MTSDLPSIQLSKAATFRKLHQGTRTFVMPCAWDASSSIMFEELGFECIGTTSGGVNWAKGRRDYVYGVSRDLMLAEYSEVARATSLPVSGDLENGYGNKPEDVSETIERSIVGGMVGGSIEDQIMSGGGKLYDTNLAIERIVAARETADRLGIAYTLTARCEAFSSNYDDPFSEAVGRLNSYRSAGADCLFVPGVCDRDTLKKLVEEVDGPISFGMGASEQPLSINTLSALGVRRISTGGGLPRAAFSFVRDAASEILKSGTFNYLDNAISDSDINAYFQKRGSPARV